MAQKYRAVLIVMSYCIVISLCQDTKKELTAREEYVQIFSSIPKIFEYLLNVLEKRPEILENNSKFGFITSDIQRDKRESDFQAVDKDKSYERTDKDEGITERRQYGKSTEKVKRRIKSSIFHEKKEDEKALKNVDAIKTKRYDQFGEIYFGSTNTMSNISPEEVEEMALKVEKEIEDHVKNKQSRDLK